MNKRETADSISGLRLKDCMILGTREDRWRNDSYICFSGSVASCSEIVLIQAIALPLVTCSGAGVRRPVRRSSWTAPTTRSQLSSIQDSPLAQYGECASPAQPYFPKSNAIDLYVAPARIHECLS